MNNDSNMNGKNKVKAQNYELRHTPPMPNNKNISFPDEYPKGRIEIIRGLRMIDWTGNEWILCVKDGVQWFPEDFTDEDYEVLRKVLIT